MENTVQEPKKNKLRVYIPVTIITAIVLISGYLWYSDYSKYITTDDSYIEGDNVSVGSKILGRVVREYFDEGDSVRKGDLIAELDSADLLASKIQAMAVIEQAVTNKVQTEAAYASDTENIKVIVVNLEKAKDDFNRGKAQFEGNVITKETFEHLKKSLETYQAQLNAAKRNLTVSKAKIESAEASVKSAEAQANLIQTNIKNTRLYASMDGKIAKRWLLPGDITSPGQAVFTITKNKDLHVIVYLEETRISKIYNGQSAVFEIDAFADQKFHGKVYNVGQSTASQFSLIPPNNASGNFTKVTQRIPVKISIDNTESGEKVSSFKLLPGMSVVVKIIKH